ncbi:molybdopterin molybdotransferase MoeA [Paroceanicella profunda]|uniref:Molybdopterin molybdenumtransferase n=1 Tax=Paroceanicella profunda TaxID=2579971 RepID=A0A5B8G2C1_9RHOB|nr:gephyrin-like molybdotransferase Glp [Paroceanicella profunda]QDL92753.1 molybdopterin molybdotransferase MoeA [Paroceanicella profunda]
MISTEEAIAQVLALVGPLGVETVPLAEAAGRVLAEPVRAQRTQPPFASSAMDGYAVRAAEARPGMVLSVIGESAAGRRFTGALGPGEAVRIFTGAPVPEGADSILIQEDAEREGDRITVREGRDTQSYIRPAGGDFTSGTEIPAPCRITPNLMSLLAAMNIARVPVARRPVIGLLPTGDELVWPGEEPGPDQIVSSNNFGLKALLETQGAEVRLLPIARDRAEALRAALDLARGCDMLVTLGGASVGDHDLVQQVLREEGLDLAFYKIAMRPGKPLMAGRLRGMVMVGLPGNPVSSMVCGHVFLRPTVDRMLGLPAGPLPRLSAPLAVDIGSNGPREHYMRARLENGRLLPASRQDSSLLSVLADASALLVRPPHDGPRTAGERMEYIPL